MEIDEDEPCLNSWGCLSPLTGKCLSDAVRPFTHQKLLTYLDLIISFVVMPDFIARKLLIDQTQCNPGLLFSFALVGDHGVGKTSLLVQMVEDRFVSEIIPSAANDYGLRMFHSPDDTYFKIRACELQGMDLRESKHYQGILLIYDVTKKSSFDRIDQWIGEIRRFANRHAKVILLANKTDEICQRVVTSQQGLAKASHYNISYLEVSAKTGMNIDNAFGHLVGEIDQHIRTGKTLALTRLKANKPR